MERFLDLSNRDAVIERVLKDWLLRELRDDVVSRITWRAPTLVQAAQHLRFSVDESEPLEVYYLTPVGLGGRFFYENPMGEALYSAECRVVVDYEETSVRRRLAEGRLYWVGSDDPRGYRISEGFESFWEALWQALKPLAKGAPTSKSK